MKNLIYRGTERRKMKKMRKVIESIKECFVIVLFGALFGVIVIVFSPSPPQVKGWEVFTVTEPNTRVWNLARRCDPDGDPRIALELIKKENRWIVEKDYDIRVGDKISLPIING